MSGSRVAAQMSGWPRSPLWLLIAAPIVFVLMLGVFRATEALIGWPKSDRERDVATFVALGVAILPLAKLVISDAFQFLSETRAQVEASAAGASLKFNFSQAIVEVVATAGQIHVPENILLTAQKVNDSTSNEIVRAVQRVTATPIGMIDLGDGHEWWVTRLLSLAAGAERFGSMGAFVFVAKKAHVDGTFVGWAEPRDVLDALLRSYPDYATEYYEALSESLQRLAKGAPRARATPGGGHADGHQHDPDYVFMKILMERLAFYEPGPPPDATKPVWLTCSLLEDHLGHILYDNELDQAQPVERQIDAILTASGRYIAVVRGGRFLGLAKVDNAVRLIVKQLVQALEQPEDKTATARTTPG